MSVLCVVAVYDSAVQAYGRPVFVVARGAAIRQFIDEVRRSEPQGNAMHDHPSDFELRYLALYDEATGEFQQAHAPEVLMRGKDVEQS